MRAAGCRIAGLALVLLAVGGLARPIAAAEEFDLDCGADRVIAGVSGKAEQFWFAYVIGELRPHCVAVAPDGSWASSPWLGEVTSAGGGDAFSMTCPQGHAVHRIWGTRGAYVDSLAVYCRSLSDPDEQLDALGHFGGDGADEYDVPCAGAQVARRLTGTSGAVVDTLDLECHDIPYGSVNHAPVLVSPSNEYVAPDLRTSFHWGWNALVQDPALIPFSEVCLTTAAAHAAGDFCDVGPLTSDTAVNLTPTQDLPVTGRVHWSARGCSLGGECGPWGEPARWLNLPEDAAPPPQVTTATFDDDLYPVYAHPRCTNCHGGYSPFGVQQGDSDLHPNQNMSNLGNPGACAGCHQIDDGEWQTWKDPDDNPGQIPLFAVWDSSHGGTGAPARTAGEICATVRGEVLAHGWDADGFRHHVEEDALIGWSFAPAGNMDDVTEGQSASDVMARADWVAISMGWFAAGMPCAGEANEEFAYEPATMADAGRIDPERLIIDVLGGLLGRQLLPEGVRLPERLPGPKPPGPVLGRAKMLEPPARNTWARGPIEGPLTAERVRRLERSGLHPRFATLEEVRRVLGSDGKR